MPLLAAWSNFHVECVFGVLLLLVFAASGTDRAAWITCRVREAALGHDDRGGGALATLPIPYGWGLRQYLYENLSVPGVVAIAELLPPPLPCLSRVLRLSRADGRAADRSIGAAFALSEAAAFGVFGAFGLLHLRETPLVLLATAPGRGAASLPG